MSFDLSERHDECSILIFIGPAMGIYWLLLCPPALPMRLAIAHLALVNPELQLQPLLTHPHHHHHCHHLSQSQMSLKRHQTRELPWGGGT